MAGRFTCWVIVTGDGPTAFRARDKEDLATMLKQLLRTQPDAVVKWFERGKLWTSPEEADEAFHARRRVSSSRGKGWRPGGKHVDPRAQYDIPRDEKRARFKRRMISGFKKTDAPGTEGGRASVKRPRVLRPKKS